MKTALQQLIEWGNQMIGDHPAKTLSFYEAIDKAEELLEVEKEQTEENMAKAITFGWELSHYHRDKEPEKLLQMQKDFIITIIKGGDK
jgi:hypothetical protein